MSRKLPSTRKRILTRSQLPAQLVPGCEYFVEAEGIIIVDHGTGPVAYGKSTISSVAGKTGDVKLDIEDIHELPTLLNSKLSDAPSNGKQYARKDEAWLEVVATGGGAHGCVVFETAGSFTWTVPAGVKEVYVSGCGGGAGGNQHSVNSGNTDVGAGGASGGWVIKKRVSVTALSVIQITIGAGGEKASATTPAASYYGGRLGRAGGTTSFGNLLTLTGGGASTSRNYISGVGGEPNGQPSHCFEDVRGASTPFGNGGASTYPVSSGYPFKGSTGFGAGGHGSRVGWDSTIIGDGAPGLLIIEW